MDLAPANAGAHNVSVLLGKGDGTCLAAAIRESGGRTPQGIAAGDLDLGGLADVVVTHASSNDVAVPFAMRTERCRRQRGSRRG